MITVKLVNDDVYEHVRNFPRVTRYINRIKTKWQILFASELQIITRKCAV